MEFNLSFKFGGKKIEEKAPEPVKETISDARVTYEPPFGSEENQKDTEELIRKVFREEEEHYALEANRTEKPIIDAGRVSIYEGLRNYLPNSNSPVVTNFNFKVLQYIQYLSIWNPHISMAVENIVSLGNTDYDIDFGQKTDKALVQKYRQYLWDQVPKWYEFSDGEDALDNDLLTQLAIAGTISSEAVIANDLRSIQSIVKVDPFYVRFAYDAAQAKHIPLQEIGGIQKQATKYPGYIELNTATYSYMAMRRMGEMPYAIPPFASALESIAIENDMVKNLQNMMKRLGMMGFLEVLVNAPKQLPGELAEKYQARLTTYLESLRPGVEKGFSRGIVMGFTGTHEFNVHAPMNPAAAEGTTRIIKSLVFAGVKQDPNMHGENYSTTETFGRVIMEKMVQQVSNYQRTLGAYKAKLFKLALLLNGVIIEDLTVTYKKSGLADELREQQILTSKINNLELLRQQGIIDQTQKAQKLGYDKPASPEPLESDAIKIAKMKPAATSTKSNSKRIKELKKKLIAGTPEFSYAIPEGCGPETLEFEGLSIRHLGGYLSSVNKQFNTAINKAKPRIVRELSKLGNESSESKVVSLMLYGLIGQWERDFSDPVNKIVEKNIYNIYNSYRKDKTVFSEGEGFSKQSFFVVPEAVFALLDYRAIEFLENVDKIYLGKFITDPDTEDRIVKWIKEKFKTGNVPIGRNSSLISEFVNEFGTHVLEEAWKIRRIIDTTANSVRNNAHVNYLKQAEIIEYQVVEVMDDRTCGWCRHMNGKIFSVQKAVEQQEKLYRDGVEYLPEYQPFATTIKLDQFVVLDARSIQAKGIRVPAHPHCRGRIIGHFK